MMDDRILRRLYAPTKALLRWSLTLVPTYATFFEQDSRPASIPLCTLLVILVAALIPTNEVDSSVQMHNMTLFGLSTLFTSICLPMPSLQLSTLRYYALLTLLVVPARCLVADLDLTKTCALKHLLASLQLLLLLPKNLDEVFRARNERLKSRFIPCL